MGRDPAPGEVGTEMLELDASEPELGERPPGEDPGDRPYASGGTAGLDWTIAISNGGGRHSSVNAN